MGDASEVPSDSTPLSAEECGVIRRYCESCIAGNCEGVVLNADGARRLVRLLNEVQASRGESQGEPAEGFVVAVARVADRPGEAWEAAQSGSGEGGTA